MSAQRRADSVDRCSRSGTRKGYRSNGGNNASYKFTIPVVRDETTTQGAGHVPPLKFWVFKENMHSFM